MKIGAATIYRRFPAEANAGFSGLSIQICLRRGWEIDKKEALDVASCIGTLAESILHSHMLRSPDAVYTQHQASFIAPGLR